MTNDISHEIERTYHFEGGNSYKIVAPVSLTISDSGRHYVVDAAGEAHCMRKDWVCVSWKSSAPGSPVKFT